MQPLKGASWLIMQIERPARSSRQTFKSLFVQANGLQCGAQMRRNSLMIKLAPDALQRYDSPRSILHLRVP